MDNLFENMSRDELIKVAKSQQVTIFSMGNNPHVSTCPLCHGSGLFSALKSSIRAETIAEANRDVTKEEYEKYMENLRQGLRTDIPSQSEAA